jgi:predicted secreted protein
MNLEPTTRRVFIVLALLILLVMIWWAVAFPVDPAGVRKALEREDGNPGQTVRSGG